jgi:glycerol uptake facilitator-like aquaporin
MSQPPTTSPDTSVVDTPEDARARTRALQMVVLGAVVAVLGPLVGFLTGSIVGPARDVGDYDAMFVAMFSGLVVGGAGAVAAGLGLLRFVRHHGRLF